MRIWSSAIAWAIASMKVYPKLFGYIDENRDRLGEQLRKEGVQTIALEVYEANPERNCVSYYVPIEKVKEFLLTPHAMPALKSMMEVKKDQ